MATVDSLEKEVDSLRSSLTLLTTQVNTMSALMEEAASTHQVSRSMILLEKNYAAILARVVTIESDLTLLTTQIDD